MSDDVFPSWPCFPEDEVNAVDEVLRSGRVNYWTGEHGRLFEEEFAAYCGVSHGIALANGTVALELALRVLDIGPGDEVIVPPRTFIATVSSVVLNGATPVFAEVDRESQVITANSIRNCITSKTKAVIVVHLAGWPCDMDQIMELADEFGLKVVEDCAQAHGARYKDKAVGGFGDAAAFSFCQDKIMSTGGEGGMLLINDECLWERAWSYKDHGKSLHAISRCNEDTEEIFCWAHESFGTNWRMTEMQSAIGRIQLKKLDEWVRRRRSNARVFEERLSQHKSLRIPIPDKDIYHSYYKFYAFVRPDYLKSGWGRDKLVREINAEGAPCFHGSCGEVYRETAFKNAGLAPAERLSVAKELGETSLMFPVHPTLCEDDVCKIIDAVDKVLAKAAI
jgi:dTDP-4-amino-4,6-dideoxygalactose transaminase